MSANDRPRKDGPLDFAMLHQIAMEAAEARHKKEFYSPSPVVICELVRELITARMLQSHVRVLVNQFYQVFDEDWEFTLGSINDPLLIKNTFLRPEVDDPSNNWANRGVLLNVLEVVEMYLDRVESPENTVS